MMHRLMKSWLEKDEQIPLLHEKGVHDGSIRDQVDKPQLAWLFSNNGPL